MIWKIIMKWEITLSNNNDDYKIKYYDLYSIINYIKEIIKKIELENVFSSDFNKFFK